MTIRKLPIPDTAGLPPDLRERIEPIKQALEQITGRRGEKAALLTRRSTTGDIVNAVNGLINLLQDTENPGTGAAASEWTAFTPAATGATSGSGTVVDNGCAWRVADRMVDVLYDVTLSSTGTVSGALMLSFPVEVPLPANNMVFACGREVATTGQVLTSGFDVTKGRRLSVLKADGTTIATNAHRYTLHVRWPTR